MTTPRPARRKDVAVKAWSAKSGRVFLVWSTHFTKTEVARRMRDNAWPESDYTIVRVEVKESAQADTCSWDADEDGAYDSDCGHKWEFIHGGPKENGMNFCCYCGRPLVAGRAKK